MDFVKPRAFVCQMTPCCTTSHRTRSSSSHHRSARTLVSGYPRWLVGGAVPRLPWDHPDVAGYLRRKEPVVLTGGCPLTVALVGQWDLDYLAREFGSFDGLPVHFVPHQTPGFARSYGRGLGAGGVCSMSFQIFVELLRAKGLLAPPTGAHQPASTGRLQAGSSAEPARSSAEPAGSSAEPAGSSVEPFKYYLQVPIAWFDEEPGPQGESVVLDGPMRRAPFGPRIERDVRALGWSWLREACETASAAPFKTCQMWAGHGCGATPCHFDAVCNFLSQLCGRKQVLLFPPSQSFHLYPHATTHPMDNFITPDLHTPDVSRFPALRHARGIEAVLEPGDVLWLPRFYWHYVNQLDPGEQNLSLNFWVGHKDHGKFLRDLRHGDFKADAPCAPHTLSDIDLVPPDEETGLRWLHASRLAEGAVRKWVSDGNGGQFLNALAAGADLKWDPSSAAAGMARRLRDELSAVLRSHVEVQRFLMAITRDGRLHPGLAPEVEGPIVSSEERHGGLKTTPPQEMERIRRETINQMQT